MRIVQEALTYDDVLLLPQRSSVLPREVELETKFSRGISLKTPLAAAAMDTVTEAPMAIAMAQKGGIGIIHKNNTIEQQAEHVRRVKKFESGVVKDPITVTPTTTIRELNKLTRQHNFSGMPVVEGEKVVGIVTNRDVRFETKLDQPVSAVMTPKEKLVTVQEGASRDEVLDLLHKNRIEKVLVVDGAFHLRGMITVRDILRAEDYPHANKDGLGRLIVGAAVGNALGTEDRVAALVEAGVDAIVLDSAHGHSQGVLDRIAWIKKTYPDVQLVGGNIATADAAKAMAEAGVDAVKVGIGPGSICTTRIVAGVGVPQVTAIANVVAALEDTGIPVIADGGIRFSGDIAKAIAAGASCIMIGGLFAGTEEAPGTIELYKGRSYKTYRGMGSVGAMAEAQGSSDRYFQDVLDDRPEKLVPEGIEGRVPYKGPVSDIIHQLMGGLRASMGYTGCASIDIMRHQAKFVRITAAGMRESHVHDVDITKEAPNYWIG